jgi:hypothetical protein
MGESTPSIDVTAFVGFNTGFIKAKTIGVWLAANSEQNMTADDLLGTFIAVRIKHYSTVLIFDADAAGAGAEFNGFVFTYLPDSVRNIFVFTHDQTRPHFNDGYAAAEATIHLGKLQPDIATTNFN